jgi:hypothetical protein
MLTADKKAENVEKFFKKINKHDFVWKIQEIFISLYIN